MRKVFFLVIIIPLSLFSYVNDGPPKNGYFGGSRVANYCHFNIPFYMSYLGDNNNAFSLLWPGLASPIGQIQYTKRYNENSKLGIGLGLPFISIYADRDFNISKNKKINTSFLVGIPFFSLSSKVFYPFDDVGRYKQGVSFNYIYYSGYYSWSMVGNMDIYPGSQVLSLNYEGLITPKNNGKVNLFFSIGANYLFLSYAIRQADNENYGFKNFVNLYDYALSDVSWDKNICWSLSFGINF